MMAFLHLGAIKWTNNCLVKFAFCFLLIWVSRCSSSSKFRVSKIYTCILEGAKPDRGGSSCCGASSSGSGPAVTPKSLAVNSHSYGQTSLNAAPRTTLTITATTNGGTASAANLAALPAEEAATNVMVNQMPPDGRSGTQMKTCVDYSRKTI